MGFELAWQSSLNQLREIIPADGFAKWIQPLLPTGTESNPRLLAPNQYVKAAIEENFLVVLRKIHPNVEVSIDDLEPDTGLSNITAAARVFPFNLKQEFTFSNFIEGKANQLALASALQVSRNPGEAFNPLFIHGGCGLGKTHLMQAIGHQVIKNNSMAEVAYVHSERFVADMVAAIRNNSMDKFKHKYRSADVLLLDDIQFFIGKERSQEEFFHTFNSLTERTRQVVITSDRYPKELNGLEERLISRCGSGLTIAIEPPDLETRVAIMKSKAKLLDIELPNEVCFFVARNFRNNVRDIEGALNRLLANHKLLAEDITVDFAQKTLRDLLHASNRQITTGDIQKKVADYYGVTVADLLSRSRKRRVTRPRHIAMSLAKDLLNASLPEIGESFGGRDHTTVINAYARVKDLRKSDQRIEHDYKSLFNTLSV